MDNPGCVFLLPHGRLPFGQSNIANNFTRSNRSEGHVHESNISSSKFEISVQTRKWLLHLSGEQWECEQNFVCWNKSFSFCFWHQLLVPKQVFVPTGMVVIISWIVFWVEMTDAEKVIHCYNLGTHFISWDTNVHTCTYVCWLELFLFQVALEVILLLTLATLSSLAQSGLPAVSLLVQTHWLNICRSGSTWDRHKHTHQLLISGALHQVYGYVDLNVHHICIFGLSSDPSVLLNCTKTK